MCQNEKSPQKMDAIEHSRTEQPLAWMCCKFGVNCPPRAMHSESGMEKYSHRQYDAPADRRRWLGTPARNLTLLLLALAAGTNSEAALAIHPAPSLTTTESTEPATFSYGLARNCTALAVWVIPLKTEYRGFVERRRTEISVRDSYKLLFSDDHFAPIFGAPIDALNGPKLEAIKQALNSARKSCRNRPSDAVKFMLAISTGALLSRPFNRSLSRTAMSYDFVVAHARARRTFLAPLNLGQGAVPNAEQLRQLTSADRSAVRLLWPSELVKLAQGSGVEIGATAQPVGTAAARTSTRSRSPSLEGEWFGSFRCRGTAMKLSMSIEKTGDGYSAVAKRSRRGRPLVATLHLAPQGKIDVVQGRTNVASEKFFGPAATLTTLFETVDLMRLVVSTSACTATAVLYKEESIPGIPVSPRCPNAGGLTWARPGNVITELGQTFERHGPPVAGFDATKASLRGLFSATHFREHFGVAYESLDGQSRQLLENQLLSCALLSIGRWFPASILGHDHLSAARKALLEKGSLSKDDLLLTEQYKALRSSRTPVQEFTGGASVLLGWEEMLTRPDRKKALEDFVRERADKIVAADPRIEYRVFEQLSQRYLEIRGSGRP